MHRHSPNTIKVRVTSPARRRPRNYPRPIRNSGNLVKIERVPLHPKRQNVSSPISFSYLNVGSIKNKTTSVYAYVDQNDIDIMTFAETWLFTDEENAIYKDSTPVGRGE